MKKQFLIIETTAEHCRGYNRATKGRETIRQVEAYSAPEALEEWLADMAQVYGISRVQEKHRGGFVKDSDPERYIWQEGDHSADLGDFVVSVEEIVEKGVVTNPAFDNLFGSLGEMLNPLTITPPKEPEQHNYSISIQFTTKREFSPQLLNDILKACVVQVVDSNTIDYKAEIE